jgi:hypothetical protein
MNGHHFWDTSLRCHFSINDILLLFCFEERCGPFQNHDITFENRSEDYQRIVDQRNCVKNMFMPWKCDYPKIGHYNFKLNLKDHVKCLKEMKCQKVYDATFIQEFEKVRKHCVCLNQGWN